MPASIRIQKRNISKIILLTLICFLSLSFIRVNAQTVNIPDANFKTYLVGNTAINTNANGEIETTEATAFTGQIDIHALGVSDLTGLEAFVNLNMLTAYNNPYTTINLTNNTRLTYIFVAQTGLTTLDVTHLPLLQSLLFGQTSISTIDLSNNPNCHSSMHRKLK